MLVVGTNSFTGKIQVFSLKISVKMHIMDGRQQMTSRKSKINPKGNRAPLSVPYWYMRKSTVTACETGHTSVMCFVIYAVRLIGIFPSL